MKFDIDVKVIKDLTQIVAGKLARIAQREIRVGVPEGAGNEDNGKSIAYVASIHEFGFPSRGIPRRSFLIDTIEENREKYAKYLEDVIAVALTKNTWIDTQLNKVAMALQNDVIAKFSNNNWKPPKYRIGSPLIDTGALRQSIRGVVRKK